MPTEPMIQARGLRKRFGETVALDGLDLEARAGTVLSVLGPNGAGKTTAVRILTTLSRPDGGEARVAGHDVIREPTAVQRMIGVAAQDATVDEVLTGRQNLVMIARLSGLSRAAARHAGPSCWRSSDSPTPGTGSSRATPAGCAAGWIWRPRWSRDRPCCSSMSR